VHLTASVTFFLALVAFACATDAGAQTTLYKWVDKDGKTNFSDKPPAGFKGEVTRVLTDAPPDAPVPSAPKAAPKKVQAPEDDKPPDMNTRRRLLREQLAARVAAAQAKVDQARKAIADGELPSDEEKQFVQQHFARDARRPERTPPPRSNCMSQVSSDGKPIWLCPRPVPGEKYYDRQKKLEEALAKAEEELADAERAYRRGVD